MSVWLEEDEQREEYSGGDGSINWRSAVQSQWEGKSLKGSEQRRDIIGLTFTKIPQASVLKRDYRTGSNRSRYTSQEAKTTVD